MSAPDIVQLRAAGVGVVLELGVGLLPRVRHWGTDLGDLADEQLRDVVRAGRLESTNRPSDVVPDLTVLPEHAAFWIGRPGLSGSRGGRDWSAAFRTTDVRLEQAADGTQAVRVAAEDPAARLGLQLDIELLAGGLLRQRAVLTNTGADGYRIDALRLVLPVPPEADELMDFTGRHTMERVPQRQPFTAGLHARETRTGRTGLDAAYVLMAGRHGFGFRSGQVWGVHVGWSGNQEVYAERLYNGARVLGGGELLEPGEVVLGTGESYETPWLYGTYGDGLDGVAARFHHFLRARDGRATRPRPVLLNTWEAVYFDHDLDHLTRLAEAAAEVGVERFVLDDGWFGARRNDRAGLGDWTVSEQMWPDGLGPLIEQVRSRGMEFGLWVEPEMVNLDSDLARAHPEWLFSAGGRLGIASRGQHVLDLGHDGAYEYVRDALIALLDEYEIAYLKWDHNRYLNDAGHTPGGEPGVHNHTLAVYRLLDELRASYPALEIESCASGGGRIDLGILQRTDRVWASDCIDALERQQIQRYTQLLVPPELMGTHIGGPESHTTHRRHELSFRAATAMWGHLGIEWDLTTATVDERATVASWVAFHKSLRPLLHNGIVVNGDSPDPALWVHGVVAADRSDALFEVVAVARSLDSAPQRIRLPGLDPDAAYELRPAAPESLAHDDPLWARPSLRLPGRVLESVGVLSPTLLPERSWLIRAVRV